MLDRTEARAGYEIKYASNHGHGSAYPQWGINDARRAKLDTCVGMSRTWVTNANVTAQGWVQNGVVNALEQNMLRAHMHLRDRDFRAQGHFLKRISTVLFAMKWGLDSPNLRIADVAGRSDQAEGYVGFLAQRRLFHRTELTAKSLHLEFRLAGPPYPVPNRAPPRLPYTTYSDRAYSRILVHEASHKFANTEDYAYAWDPRYDSLSRTRASNNADSFAYLLVSLGQGVIVDYSTFYNNGEIED